MEKGIYVTISMSVFLYLYRFKMEAILIVVLSQALSWTLSTDADLLEE